MLLDFTITPARLIDMAKDRNGLELQEMAADLGYDKTRITKLKNGKCALTPHIDDDGNVSRRNATRLAPSLAPSPCSRLTSHDPLTNH